MIVVRHRNNRFEFPFKYRIEDNFEFQEYLNFFKRHWFVYDPINRVWSIDTDQIQEKYLWMEKEGIKFELDNTAISKLEEIEKKYDISEMEYFRGRTFDNTSIKNVKLYNFQKEDINFSLKRNAFMNCNDAGLGKTIEGISVFSSLFKNNNIDGIFLLVSPHLLFHWKRGILKYSSIFTDNDIVIINDDVKIKPFENYRDKKILIIPHHLLGTITSSYHKNFKVKKSLKKFRWNNLNLNIKELWGKENILCLVDESHHYRNPKSVKTKALLSLKNKFDYRICQTATPSINHLEKLYTQINFIDKSVIKMTYDAFVLWISDEIGDRFNKKNIVSYNEKNVEELKSKFPDFMIQRLKKDTEEMKTKRIIKEIYLQLHPIQNQLYTEIMKLEIEELEMEYDIILWKYVFNKFGLIYEILDNPCLLKLKSDRLKEKINTIDKSKSDKIINLINKWKMDYDPKFIALNEKIDDYINYRCEKLIVYCSHPYTIDTLTEYYKKYKPLKIHGQIKSTKNKGKYEYRQWVEDEFNYNKDVRVIFLSALTSSEGINLYKGGNKILIYEMPNDATLYSQLSSRTYRISSTEDSLIEILNYVETLDNIRIKRAMNRVEFNELLNKPVDSEKLKDLLKGIV